MRLKETQGKPSRDFLKSLMDQKLEPNYRPRHYCTCPKVSKLSHIQVIQELQARHLEQTDNTSLHGSQDTLPRSSRRTSIPSDWTDDEDGKDNQARAPIAKPISQEPLPSTSFGTYASETLRRPNSCPKVLTSGSGKLVPPASGASMTVGGGRGIHIDPIPPVREPPISPPSTDRIVHNDRVQIYDELVCTSETKTSASQLDIC